ncbi:hypothetical protein MRB53_028470 [Persea americana]|uniref:Uncharacterized protein n=1 Tax=Persea americana TaxID=3435 RepID=A0ACC2KFZ3_PERAE|nr:hypothetical protein MRB53_028470 [Persea americana]
MLSPSSTHLLYTQTKTKIEKNPNIASPSSQTPSASPSFQTPSASPSFQTPSTSPSSLCISLPGPSCLVQCPSRSSQLPHLSASPSLSVPGPSRLVQRPSPSRPVISLTHLSLVRHPLRNKGILVCLSPHSTKIQITNSRTAQIQWRVKNPIFPAPLSHSQSNVSIITSISPNRRWRRIGAGTYMQLLHGSSPMKVHVSTIENPAEAIVL